MILTLLLACTASPEQNPAISAEEETIVGILITPEQSILSVGQTAQLKATALTSLRNSFDVTESVEWMVEYYDIIDVSEDLDSEGRLTGLSEGSSRIYAQYNDIQSPYSTVIVTKAALVSIEISPQNVSLQEGQQLQMSATGLFSDGAQGNITQQVRWLTADPDVIQIRANGVLVANGVGTTQVQAKVDRLSSAQTQIVVNPYTEHGRPDLVFEETEIVWYEETPVLETVLVNQGAVGAEEFWVDLYYQAGKPDINQVGDSFGLVQYLGPNQGTRLAFELDYWNTTALWLFADSTDVIDESHENNNFTEFYY